MRGYRLICEKNDKWHFELIPNNNRNQPIGKSRYCDSEAECRQTLLQFRKLVREQNIQSVDSPFIKIIKKEKGYCVQYNIGENILYTSRTYDGSSAKNNCIKSIKSIYANLDEYTLFNCDSI